MPASSRPSTYHNRVSNPHQPTGLNGIADSRYELKWVAGQRGKPGLNADMASGTEATREPADPDFEVLGTNAVSADTAFAPEGGILLSSHGADADSTIILPHLDTNQSAWANVTWGSDQETEWQCYIRTAASIASIVIYAGLKLTNTNVIATDDDQVFFRFAPAVGNYWVAVDSIANTDTSTTCSADTSGKIAVAAVAASTKYHLRIVIDSSRVARFYIDGVLVRVTSALTDAKDFIPYIGVVAATAAVKSVQVYGQAISRNAA